MKNTFHTQTETTKFAENFAKDLTGGQILLLQGDLGAGKTTFVKGLSKGLGIMEEIKSPTFTLMNVHQIKNNPKLKTLLHIDAYRLKNENELLEIGFEDFLNDKSILIVIEWPEKISTLLDNIKNVTKITFNHVSETAREISIN